MKRILLATVVMLAFAANAFGQETTMTMTGTVVSATNDALVVETPTGRVTFTLDSSALALWDKDMRYVVEPGEFQVMVGPSSVNLKSVTLNVTS